MWQRRDALQCVSIEIRPVTVLSRQYNNIYFLNMQTIGFSNNVFWGRYKNIYSWRLIKEIKRAGAKTVELIVDPLEFDSELKKLAPHLKEFKSVSFHLSGQYFYQNDLPTKRLLDKIRDYYYLVGARQAVIHPDRIKDWQVFNQYKMNWAIENMDSRKSDFQNPRAIGQLLKNLPNWGLVLDLNHCYDNDPTMKLAADFIRQFKKQIGEIHLSGYQNDQHHHALLYQTKQTILIDFCRRLKVPIIIESPIYQLTDLKKEFDYVVKNLK